MVIKNLDESFDKFAINVHGVFVEPIVEIVRQLLVLSLAI